MDKVLPLALDVLRHVWQQYGLFALLLVFGLALHEWRMYALWSARLKDKDKEIDRLVKERNRLQDIVLSKRLTSGGKK